MKTSPAIVILLLLVPTLMPLLLQPSNARTLLLHGSLGLTIVFFILIASATAIVRRRRAAGVSVSGSKRRPSLGRSLSCVTFIFVVLYGVFAIEQFAAYERLATIQQNGRRLTANVKQLYVDSCGRRDCSISVEYEYSPKSSTLGDSGPFTGWAKMTTDRQPSDPRLLYASRTGHVPIAYDINNPQSSALNFEDIVFHEDLVATFVMKAKLVGLAFLSVFAVLAAAVAVAIIINNRLVDTE